MQGYWENDEVRALFRQVEECKERGEKIKQAFICHAEKFARKENSVRNYYYYELKDESRMALLAVAAYFGDVRLIDNIELTRKA